MATATKPITITTPKGTFVWPKLIKPDTHFKTDGEYSVKLRVRRETPGVEALIGKIDDVAAQSLADAKAGAKTPAQAKKWETKYLPYTEVTDDDGTPTGEIEFKAAKIASGVSKKTGRPWKASPTLFDAKGTPITGAKRAAMNIGSGTVGRINVELVPYANTVQTGASCSLRLNAAQIIDLVEFGGGNAASFGFDAEDGFDADEVSAEGLTEDADGEGTGADDDDADF